MFFNKSKRLLQAKEQELADLTAQFTESEKKFSQQLAEKEASLQVALNQVNEYKSEFADILDKKYALSQIQGKIAAAIDEFTTLNEKYKEGVLLHTSLQHEISLYNDELEITSYGLYKPSFSFEFSSQYKLELENNYEKQKNKIKYGGAVICNTEWTVGGSKAEGSRMTVKYKKLMLYAFNGECEALISKVKWNNAAKARERIKITFDAVNKLGQSHNIYITEDYLKLKLEELSLTHEYEQKKYEEKEEQRMIREQMREEERAQKEFEKAQREAEDEERRFQKALLKAKAELQNANGLNASVLAEQVKELEQRLQDAHEKKERAIALAQLTKVGHIYVISNVGSFGEDVYKIGMTRRLDPLDRVRELGDASVPFCFDVHAIIYSENAPQMEYELHKKFSDRRLNRINTRKEFFKVTLEEIESFVNEHTNAGIEFTKLAEAKEYRETINLIEEVKKIVNDSEPVSTFPKSLI